MSKPDHKDGTRPAKSRISTEPQQRVRKRKSFDINQERYTKRIRRTSAQSTHLTASALESVQDKPDKTKGSKGSEASKSEFLRVQS